MRKSPTSSQTCYRRGWIHSESYTDDEKVIYALPSPLHSIHLSWILSPADTEPPHATLKEFALAVIQGFRPSELSLHPSSHRTGLRRRQKRNIRMNFTGPRTDSAMGPYAFLLSLPQHEGLFRVASTSLSPRRVGVSKSCETGTCWDSTAGGFWVTRGLRSMADR